MLHNKIIECDIKQKEIAVRLGLTEGAVSKMLTKGNLSVIQLIQLDELFHFDPEDIEILFNTRTQKRRKRND